MLNPFGKVLIELRDNVPLGVWCDERVRGEEPGPNDVHGAGEYQRFVLMAALPSLREHRLPIQYPRYNVRCYGVTPEDAMTGYGYASDAMHWIRARVHAGLGIYVSFDETGGTPGADPRTGQPYVEFVVSLIATTLAVA